MTNRIIVTESELRQHWDSPNATGLIHDYQTGHKVVRMKDGTEYATPWAEIEASA